MKKLFTIFFILLIELSFAQSVSITDFGAVPDGKTDCSVALQAAINSVPSASTNWGIPSQGHGTIQFPRGIYRFDSQIIIRTTITLEGIGSGQFPYQECQLRFMGTGGIKVIADNIGYGARSVIIRNLYLRNFGESTDSTQDGIWSNTRILLDNTAVDNFGGNGFAIVTNDSGNANNSLIMNCNAYYCQKSGIYFSGNESNNCGVYSSSFNANGMCGVLDNSFLGNHFFNCHTSFNGLRNASTYSKSWARHGGRMFQAIKYPNQQGIEPQVNPNWKNYWIENNTAFGDTTLTLQWSADSVYWVTGSYYVAGVACTSSFYGCYSEAGQSANLMNQFSICWGGDQGAIFASPDNLYLNPSASQLILHGAGLQVPYRDTTTRQFVGFNSTFGLQMGSFNTAHSITYFGYSEADHTTNLYNDASLNNLSFRVIGKGYNAAKLGLSSLPRTGAIVIPYYNGLHFESVVNGNISRAMYGSTGGPPGGTSGYAVGDFVLYMGSDSTIIGYRCISTNPMTWKTLKSAN
jgi:hypothetical protein